MNHRETGEAHEMALLRDRPVDDHEGYGFRADLEEFVADHRPHGTLTGDATEPAWNGYLLTVACPCGVVFERWVTPEDADADLIGIARLN
jgi:hypothetical protein